MSDIKFDEIFTQEVLDSLMPSGVADRFFDALYGDAEEGAWDVTLGYAGYRDGNLYFEFRLKERPGKCLACNLTYGLPDVFSRHPVINVKGIVEKIDELLAEKASAGQWQIGRTHELSRDLHVIPLAVSLAN